MWILLWIVRSYLLKKVAATKATWSPLTVWIFWQQIDSHTSRRSVLLSKSPVSTHGSVSFYIGPWESDERTEKKSNRKRGKKLKKVRFRGKLMLEKDLKSYIKLEEKWNSCLWIKTCHHIVLCLVPGHLPDSVKVLGWVWDGEKEQHWTLKYIIWWPGWEYQK